MVEFAHGEHDEDKERLNRSATATAERPASIEADNVGVPAAVGGLVVGAADDPLEAAADRAADAALARIRRMADPSAERHQHGAGCGHQGIRRSPSTTQDSAAIGYEGGALDSATNNRIDSLRGGGKPLATDLRTNMETAFGTSLGSVRIHTGNAATQISRQISAKAFTTGNDIFFGEGQFRPDSPDGAHTLAHEIAHTLQPTSAVGRLIQRVVGGTVATKPSRAAKRRAAKKRRKAAEGSGTPEVAETETGETEPEETETEEAPTTEAPKPLTGPPAPEVAPEPESEPESEPEVTAQTPTTATTAPAVKAPRLSAKQRKINAIIDNALDGYDAFDGYVGGDPFYNNGAPLPRWDEDGERIYYQEWDIYPWSPTRSRGKHRVVTGSDGSAYYTSDHYKSFHKER